MLTDCKGCAERREAMRKLTERFTEWMKNPLAPRPGSPGWVAEQNRILGEFSLDESGGRDMPDASIKRGSHE